MTALMPGPRSRAALVAAIAAVLLAGACTPLPPIEAPTPSVPSAPIVTRTPTPGAVARTDLPCAVAATRTPPPGAPTYMPAPGGNAGQTRYVDPHIEICADRTTLSVGESVHVVGWNVDIGMPYYQLYVKDDSLADFVQFAQATYDDQVKPMADAGRVLAFVSAAGEQDAVVVELRARAPGTAQLRIAATGEVHYGYPGPATWAGGGSDVLTITVTNP